MFMFAFIGGGLYAAVALALRLRDRKDAVAFTPFLTFASLATMFVFGGYLLS